MNKGIFSFPSPLVITRKALTTTNANNFQFYETAGTYSFSVPDGVFEIGIYVVGGGGNGTGVFAAAGANGGGGGGFAMGILSVSPNQNLPVITVGSQGGTSSVGSLVTATGGTNATTSTVGTGGTGAVSSELSNKVTFSGGNGGASSAASGSANSGGGAGSPQGNGTNGLLNDAGGSVANLGTAISNFSNKVSAKLQDPFYLLLNSKLKATMKNYTASIGSMIGVTGINAVATNPISTGNDGGYGAGGGFGSWSTSFNYTAGNGGCFGGGGGCTTSTGIAAGNGGIGGGGGGSYAQNSTGAGGTGGNGCVVLFWHTAEL